MAYDGTTGIAMLCVEKRQLSADTTAQVAAATLSSFSALSQGTIVIAIGSPLGEPFSILTGNVTSSSYEVSTVDANYKVISTDINASDAGSGALINLKGEVVGLMLQSYSTREAQKYR
ncbi:MAG: serine protease [Eubacterium ramulus]